MTIVNKDNPHVIVENLSVTFMQGRRSSQAVNEVSFQLHRGEVLCLLGESGSGKSVTLRALLGLLPERARVSGRINVGEHDVSVLHGRSLRAYRGAVTSMIFQEPMNALDPVFPVGFQIAETVRRHMRVSRKAAKQRALELIPSHSRGCCWAGLKLPTGSFAHQDPHLWRKRLLANA